MSTPCTAALRALVHVLPVSHEEAATSLLMDGGPRPGPRPCPPGTSVDATVLAQARARRDELADDDVSLRPRRVSTLPSMAASVSTLVVSWKEAAERKLSTASEALVMPRMSPLFSSSAGSPPSSIAALVLGLEHVPVDELAGQELGVPAVSIFTFFIIWRTIELDVFVVDLDAL